MKIPLLPIVVLGCLLATGSPFKETNLSTPLDNNNKKNVENGIWHYNLSAVWP